MKDLKVKVSVIKGGEVIYRQMFDSIENAEIWARNVSVPEWGLSERPELNEMGEPTGVILPAEYTIEIIDLEQDPEYLLQKCYENRRREYPPMEDYLDAVVKGDATQMQEYVDKCLAVKTKWPKPV